MEKQQHTKAYYYIMNYMQFIPAITVTIFRPDNKNLCYSLPRNESHFRQPTQVGVLEAPNKSLHDERASLEHTPTEVVTDA